MHFHLRNTICEDWEARELGFREGRLERDTEELLAVRYWKARAGAHGAADPTENDMFALEQSSKQEAMIADLREKISVLEAAYEVQKGEIIRLTCQLHNKM